MAGRTAQCLDLSQITSEEGVGNDRGRGIAHNSEDGVKSLSKQYKVTGVNDSSCAGSTLLQCFCIGCSQQLNFPHHWAVEKCCFTTSACSTA
jgi:hypothetical protein